MNEDDNRNDGIQAGPVLVSLIGVALLVMLLVGKIM